MSDELNNEASEPDTTAVNDAEPQGEAKAETDWKAEARKWESRAKAAKSDSDDAIKWREYEAAQKPIQERLAEELAQTKAEAEAARLNLNRYEVATEKGIPSEALPLLSGSTREELESNADALLALIATQSKPKTLLPDGNQGKPASDVPGQITDRSQLAGMTPVQIMEARASGRLDGLLGK